MNGSACGVRTWIILLVGLLSPASQGWAEEAIRLQEAYSVGYQYHVSSRVEVSGRLTLPPEKGQAAPKSLPVTGESAIEYDERVLALTSGGDVEKAARIYRRMDFQRQVGERPQQSTLRPQVRRLVLLRLRQVEVPFSLDGPLTWGEIDLVRTDVFTPALKGLLPANPVRTGDRWTAQDAAVQELTDLERVEEGKLECRLEQVTVLDGRRLARVSLTGMVRGVNEDGPNRQQLDGYYFFDLESQHLGYLSLKGTHFLLDKDGKESGRVEGRFVLTRQAHQRCPDLTEESLRGLVLEPNADNTLLLYDNPDLGVRFLHPRRWRMGGVRGRQLVLDETNGSGLLLTLESPQQVPTGAQFFKESQDWLTQQKAKVLQVGGPWKLQGPPQALEHFRMDVDMGGQRALLESYVVRQTAGGATLAARLLTADQENLRKEVERIARSVVITRPITDPKK